MTPTTMKALVKESKAPGLTLRELPVPEPGPGEVLIRVEATCICGTDVHIYKSDDSIIGRMAPNLPTTIGHEFCGYVESVGEGVTAFSGGEYVSAEMHLVCGHCYQCRTGFGNICNETRIAGVDLDGAFAEYVKLPATNVLALPENLRPEIGGFLDALGNAVHSTQVVSIPGRTIAVMGCGPIGCMTIALARFQGASTIFATDVVDDRLTMAYGVGAERTYNVAGAGRDEFLKALLAETGGNGADLVFEMSGNPQSIKDSFKVVRMGGAVVLLGLGNPVDGFDLARDVIFKGITIHGIIGRRMYDTWYEMLGLLKAGLGAHLGTLITHRLPLERYEEAFGLLTAGQAMKVVLYPGRMD